MLNDCFHEIKPNYKLTCACYNLRVLLSLCVPISLAFCKLSNQTLVAVLSKIIIYSRKYNLLIAEWQRTDRIIVEPSKNVQKLANSNFEHTGKTVPVRLNGLFCIMLVDLNVLFLNDAVFIVI